MNSPLTVNMLVRNNQETIQNFLDSTKEIKFNLLVGDLGSSDKTIDILAQKGAKIIKLAGCEDFAKARNELISQTKTDWILQLEPYESFLSGLEIIKNAVAGPAYSYNFGVMQGDIITRQTRLWHKSIGLKFTNPVYETIENESNFINVFLSSANNQNYSYIKELTKKWHERQPLLPDPVYYMACNELLDKNWDSFINYADLYLHQQKKPTISYYMTHYYMSMVLCYMKKDYKNSLNHIVNCIIKKPTMAEFWCMLADIFYAIKQYDKAFSFYNNAKILGSRRLAACDWPMEISKYDQYPTKMIDSCKKMMKNTTLYYKNSE